MAIEKEARISLTDDEIVTELVGGNVGDSSDPDSSDFPDGGDIKSE